MAGLYIHIPFCADKCFYCDFYSGNQLYLLDEYVESIVTEIKLRSSYIEDNQISTIYLGGGTPSLLTKKHLAKIFECIGAIFFLSSDIEITIECNPENITKEYVNDLFGVGVNRISLGIQFLEDAVLTKYNRKHSKSLIFNALEYIEDSKFDNLSVDLIYSVPEIDDLSLKNSLNELLNFDIKHISAYSLTVAENSQLFWKIKKGVFKDGTEDSFFSQYHIIQKFCIENGYAQYEVSNYARNGYMSKHNLAYWNQTRYLGVGVSAHSYNLVSRQWNNKNIKKYIRDLKVGYIDCKIEQLNDIEIYNEYIILRLRTFQGISMDYIRKAFSIEIYNHFKKELNELLGKGHFIKVDHSIIPNSNDLLIGDYLARKLML